MEVWILLGLFFTHFIADFILQPHEMAQNKSKKLPVLFKHVLIHFVCFIWMGWQFALLNMILHALIDWNIWRGYKRYLLNKYAHTNARLAANNVKVAKANRNFDKGMFKLATLKDPADHPFWNDHWFYVTIGLDQFLHASCYIGLYFLLGGPAW